MVRFATLGFTLSLVVGCAGGESPSGESTQDRLESGENVDVQVVSAASGHTISFGMAGSGYDPLKCNFSDREPMQGNQYTARAKADCTDEVARAQKRPPINAYHEPLAWIRENPSLSYVTFRHWCTEVDVTVAVKAAAWDSPSFEGIGFYGYERALNEADGDRRVFYAKDDARLVRTGERKLKNGERVYLYRFGGAGPCDINGSGDNPTHSIEFKPFVRYSGDVERWEAVKENHGLAYAQHWDRSGDLLE